MRRLLFLFSCGCLVWVLFGVRDVAPSTARPATGAPGIERFIHRREVVSRQFATAFAHARQRVKHANRVLSRAADELDRLTGG